MRSGKIVSYTLLMPVRIGNQVEMTTRTVIRSRRNSMILSWDGDGKMRIFS